MTERPPVVVYVSSGWTYLVYTIWSVRSLRRFGYEPIEVVVANERERRFFRSRVPDVSCEAVDVPDDGYHVWMWKVYALDRYELRHPGRDVVVSDGDVLWHQDPTALFERFAGQFWFHKLHEMDPEELTLPSTAIPRERSNWLDLISFAHYRERYGFVAPQRYMLSSGLFMVPADHYRHLVARWAAAGRGLPREQARRNQVLLSVVASELGLEPVRDREAGYAVAKHYLSDMKGELVQDAARLELDPDGLRRFVRASLRLRSLRTAGLDAPRAVAQRVSARLARDRV
jgi:hypothetical protein